MLSIPTESDWRSERWCLDAEHAYKNLSGKSHDQAVEIFRENCLVHQEDVMFMPSACFPFYANAYMAYLLSEQANGDSDGAKCFLGLVQVRLNDVARADKAFIKLVVDTLQHLGGNQEWYDAEESIYGSFRDQADKLIGKLKPKLGA